MTTIVYTGTREPDAVAGVELVHLPMLVSVALPLPPTLVDELKNAAHPTRHAVFYSRSAAETVIESLGAAALATTTVWAVGEQTAKWLGSLLEVAVRHPAHQVSSALVAELRGAISPDDLVISFELEGSDRPLNRGDVPCRILNIETYRTVPTNWDDLDSVLRRAAPRWVVFASPRAYAVFRENLHHRVIGDSYRVAAIGPTTRDAIEQAGDRVDFVPVHPDVRALLAELGQST